MSPERSTSSSPASSPGSPPVQHPLGDDAALNAASSTLGVAAGGESGSTVREGGAGSNAARGQHGLGSGGNDADPVAATAASLEEIVVASDVDMEVEEEDDGGNGLDVNETPKEGAESSVAGGEEPKEGGNTTESPPVQIAVRRPKRRDAAVAADKGIAAASREDLRRISAPRKRPVVTDEDLESAEPDYMIAEDAMISKRMVDEHGVVWYFVKWAEAETEEERHQWVTREDCAGATHWLKLVDDWVAEKERCAKDKGEAPGFSTFIRSHRVYLTLGANSGYTCVYEAVRTAIKLLGSSYRLTDEETKAFEEERGIDRDATQGLTRQHANMLFVFMANRGWSVDVTGNLYKGKFTGFCGMAWAITKPGIYIVATCSAAREGHCFVVEATRDLRYFLHEGEARLPLGDYRHAHHILWIRRVTPAETPSMEPDIDQDEQPVKLRPMKSFGVKENPKKKKKKARRSMKKKPAAAQVVTGQKQKRAPVAASQTDAVANQDTMDLASSSDDDDNDDDEEMAADA